MKQFALRLMVAIFMVCINMPSFSQTATPPPTTSGLPQPGCNDAKIWGKQLISDICWSCILPVTFAGWKRGGEPPGSNTQKTCSCADSLGVPSFGFPFGTWLPYRLIEITRNPFCMPALGGKFINKDWLHLAGQSNRLTAQFSSGPSPESGTYYHTHVWSFPLATMMELVTSKECNPGGYTDMDIMLLSEFDPMSADELLGMFMYFESAMFANPVALAACGLECGTLSSGIPPKFGEAWWCAGCWGGLYPLANRVGVNVSMHTSGSLLAARMLAIKHRRFMGHKTYGSANMCGGSISMFMPKEQYKWQQAFPMAEAASGHCCHWTGESEYKTGGSARNIPYTGEDSIQLLFRFVDCCAH